MNKTVNLFEEIYNFYKKLIYKGVIKKGEYLPSVREVALARKINPNTVVKAYNLLINDGLIQAINKKGYLVIYSTKNNKDQNLINELDDIKKQGYTKEEIINALEEVYKND